MQRRILISIACGVAIAAAAWLVAAPGADTTPEYSAGYRVYIDPATGGLTSQPSGPDAQAIDKDIQHGLSTSSVGLRQEPSPVPGGGVMVDLQGRFQNVYAATLDEDGNLSAPCVSGLPADEHDTGEAHHE